MKNDRQSMILEIISQENIETQEQLLARLQERGITEVYEAPRLTPQKLVNSVLCFRFQYDSCAW